MIRGLIEDYYDIQKVRIAIEGQLRSINQKVAKGEEKWIRTNVFGRLEDIEKEIYKRLGSWVKEEPIYQFWLKDIKGVGPVLSAGLIAWLGDVKRFRTISSLWAYCGYSSGYVLSKCKRGHKLISSSLPSKCPVFKDRKGRRCLAEIELIEKVEGKPPKRERGYHLQINLRLKAHLWKVGESFVRSGRGYRELYKQFRAEYDEKWQSPDDCGSQGCKNKGKGKCMKGHRYAAAKRKTVKVFLAHLWMKWRELNRLPIEHPFIIGKNGHQHLIPPCEE